MRVISEHSSLIEGQLFTQTVIWQWKVGLICIHFARLKNSVMLEKTAIKVYLSEREEIDPGFCCSASSPICSGGVIIGVPSRTKAGIELESESGGVVPRYKKVIVVRLTKWRRHSYRLLPSFII